jgi:hypothetical protein
MELAFEPDHRRGLAVPEAVECTQSAAAAAVVVAAAAVHSFVEHMLLVVHTSTAVHQQVRMWHRLVLQQLSHKDWPIVQQHMSLMV